MPSATEALHDLVDAGLYGAGLIEVSTPTMVGRYNDCLVQLGIAPTELQRFRVDSVGWSPEVAEEKGERLYLMHGFPNQMAVILTPDQRRRPIYHPVNSFDRRMMDGLHEQFGEEIADVTSTHGIAVSIDQGLTEISSPEDLLMVTSVRVSAQATSGLLEAAERQRAMAMLFVSKPDAWMDASLRAGICASAALHGDMRSRKLDLPTVQFRDLRSYYTEALGGAFVIRTDGDWPDIVVAEDERLAAPGKRGRQKVYWVNDPGLPALLLEQGVLEINLPWFAMNLNEVDYRMRCLAVEAISAAKPDLDILKLTEPQFRRELLSVRSVLSPAYGQLERLRKRLEGDGSPPLARMLDTETQLLLLHPSSRHEKAYRSVIWQLVCRFTQHDPLRLYIADKNRFFEAYATWPRAKQSWAAETVRRLYRPHYTNTEPDKE